MQHIKAYLFFFIFTIGSPIVHAQKHYTSDFGLSINFSDQFSSGSSIFNISTKPRLGFHYRFSRLSDRRLNYSFGVGLNFKGLKEESAIFVPQSINTASINFPILINTTIFKCLKINYGLNLDYILLRYIRTEQESIRQKVFVERLHYIPTLGFSFPISKSIEFNFNYQKNSSIIIYPNSAFATPPNSLFFNFREQLFQITVFFTNLSSTDSKKKSVD